MPDSTAALELLVSLKDEASKGMDDIAQKGGGLGGVFTDVVGKGALVAGGGILALGGFLVGATKAASDEQVGMDRLGATLGANIPNWTGNESAAEGFVSKMEGLAFADDAARDSLNQLVPRTHDLAEAQKLSLLAADLARAKNIDLATATDIVGKVYGGNVGILGRYGIAVDKGATSTEALAAIQKMAGGQAQTYADSAAGSMDKLQVAFGDAVETIGHEFLPIVTGALKGVADFIQSPAFQAGFQAFADFLGTAIPNAIGFFQGAVQAIMPIVQPFFQAIMDFLGAIAGGGDAFASLGTLFQNLGTAIGNAWSIVGPALGNLLGNILNWIGTNGPTILAQLLTWAYQFDVWIWTVAIPNMLAALGGLIQQLWGWIQANGPGILTQLGIWAQQFGAWVWNVAIPALLTALGGLISALWNWIVTNGPGILTQLGQWAAAFAGWVLTTALPALLSALGSLIGSLWNWIVENGPGIATQLLTWAQIFGNWVLTTALPWLLSQLGSLISAVWNWITTNGPGIVQQLLTWAAAFGNWVLTTALPALLSALGSLLGSLWNWIVGAAPGIYQQLQTWKDQFFNWVMTSVLPNLPIWLGNIASALWTWLTQVAKDLGSKLVNEWLPAFWQWITGPGGVLAHIGTFLGQIAQSIWTWITTTAGDAARKVLAIGEGIVSGIKQGVQNGWTAFTDWLGSIIKNAISSILAIFGIHSPSSVMADQVGKPLVEDIQAGIAAAWPRLVADYTGRLGSLVSAGSTPHAGGSPSTRPPAQIGTPVGGNAVGLGGLGFAGAANNGPLVSVQQLVIHAYPGMDGSKFASSFIEAIEEELSASVRTRRGA